MSDSVRPHRQQPTRLPHPRDSPGKNTGMGCHFLLQCMKEKSQSEVAQSCPTLRDPMDWSLPGSSIHGTFQARVLEWGAIAFSKDFYLGCFYYMRKTGKSEFYGKRIGFFKKILHLSAVSIWTGHLISLGSDALIHKLKITPMLK